MIIDNIENLKIYKNIPNEVIDFLSRLNLSDIELGKKVLSDNVYLNIEEYNTTRSGKGIKLKDNDLVATISLLDNNKKQYLFHNRLFKRIK